jgi:hypothetical protein
MSMDGKSVYSKFQISSATGGFESTGASWEISSNQRVAADAGNQTAEAQRDSAPEAAVCMVKDLEFFKNSECSEPMDYKVDAKTKNFMIYLSNQKIQLPYCEYADVYSRTGLKARSYCEDESTVTFNAYNGANEDPHCLRPYPANGTNFTSYTAKSGECVRVGYEAWARMEVVPNDGKALEYNSDWD